MQLPQRVGVRSFLQRLDNLYGFYSLRHSIGTQPTDTEVQALLADLHLLQNMAECGCGAVYVGREGLCKPCLLTASERELRVEQCVICMEDVRGLHAHEEECCKVLMHAACHREMVQHGLASRCPHCRKRKRQVTRAPTPGPGVVDMISSSSSSSDSE